VSDRRVIKGSKQSSGEPSVPRRVIVAAALPVALFAAVIVQLTVVNRLPLPGGDVPDLVLLLVAAVAVTSNPTTGALTGFAGGLAIDIAPPVTHYAGEYALVYCLVGYLAARVMAAIYAASSGARSGQAISMAVMAAAVAAGEAGKAALGLLLSDPDVTGPAIKHALPGALLFDLLLTPVVYWLVWRVAEIARPAPARAPGFAGARRLASVFRLASAGAAPNLRLAGTGAKFETARPARREPNLHLADGKSKSLARTYRAFPNTAQLPLAGGRATKLNFTHSRSALRAEGGALTRPVRTPKLNFAADRHPITPRRRKSPGKGWLNDSGRREPRAVRRARATPGKGWLNDSGRREPRAVRRARATPGKGWLNDCGRRKPTPARRARPGKGWLRPATRPRPNWYSNGPSTGWIRRSRAKARWRTRRRALPASLLSTVRELLPTGGRR
jgi:rod shape-determining protein MreD